MRQTRFKSLILMATFVAVVVPVWAQEQTERIEYTGYLSDYTRLEIPAEGEIVANLLYVAPGALEKVGKYTAVLVDEPELFIDPESKYKGMKGSQMQLLGEAFQQILAEEIGKSFRIAEEPGPDVMLIRTALGQLYLKKRRSVLHYTPIGLVTTPIRNAAIKDLTKKLSLVEASVEVEVLDSQTGEQLVAAVSHRGVRKDKETDQKEESTSWEEITALMHRYGARARCRLENARLPREQWVDCLAQDRVGGDAHSGD